VLDEFTDVAFTTVIDKMLSAESFNKAGIRNGAMEVYSLQKAVELYHAIYQELLQ
jgi:hypothetical protein